MLPERSEGYAHIMMLQRSTPGSCGKPQPLRTSRGSENCDAIQNVARGIVSGFTV